MKHNLGIGATDELSLRVSVATLARVIFKHPGNNEAMLALERKATLLQNEVIVKSQPFGGAIRIQDLDAIHNLIGDFHFDSERSRSEQDFRIFIQPASWSALREFCIQHLSLVDDPILETDPTRELVEEFYDTLKINLQPEQYASKPVATVVENDPTPTNNIHAKNVPTVRVYRIFETTILDATLARIMLNNSAGVTSQDLNRLAMDDHQHGGKGRANAVLVLSLHQIRDHYLALPAQLRNSQTIFKENKIDETVSAVLDDIAVPKYEKLNT